VLALQLVEEGLLDLQRPVIDYLPWWTVQSRFAPITVHHLLTHTSGLIADSDRAPASSWDVLALADTETGFEPGEHRHYSNMGYRLAGVVLETVSGRPYGELLQERVLDRLGLRASSPVMLHDTRRRLPGGHVPYYDDRPWRREHGLAPAPWVESAEADGCSCCSAEDLAGAFRLGEAALAVAKGGDPHDRQPESDEPLVDDGSCPPPWSAFPGRFRAHNPWLPTFSIAARDGRLVMGTDWMNGSERFPLVHLGANEFRVGEREWSSERVRFDTVIDGHAQRATYSGPYYRAFTS
jgi:CubicO group peptidase (beta-lactamase class C family)